MKNNTCLLLVGRTGNGKSSSGNSILGRKQFTPRGASAPATNEIDTGTLTTDNGDVTVVDGPGIGDSGFDDPEGVKSTLDMVEKAIQLFQNGFNALLIVLKYGVRYTKQESDALKMIKSFFGQNVVKNYGVIVMTYGDSFDLDMEDEPMTFKEWCQGQTGEVKDLFEECDNRCVLFNNKSKDQDVKEAQYKTLMSMVDRIQSKLGPYTDQDFQKAEDDRRQIIVGSKLPELREKTKQVLDRIYSDLGQQNARKDLKNFETQLANHKAYLETETARTDVGRQLIQEVEIAQMNITAKINQAERKQAGQVSETRVANQSEARPREESIKRSERRDGTPRETQREMGRGTHPVTQQPQSYASITQTNTSETTLKAGGKSGCCSII